ncbi:unnamed protein product [Moneuplotes crassus]|uniref:Uncharacterized protein n=1 Tax=Euplotes crassus TaxID=5936 RepID=A0AAD1ULC8_EUPCR|nr:unnamed protein product [Moneuplotes crassus]
MFKFKFPNPSSVEDVAKRAIEALKKEEVTMRPDNYELSGFKSSLYGVLSEGLDNFNKEEDKSLGDLSILNQIESVSCLDQEINASENNESSPKTGSENINGLNKIILRMFRRFYHKLFVKDNKILAKKRFKNCHSDKILEACRELLRKHFASDPSEDFVRFLFRILRIKTNDTLECVNDHDKDAIDISINMISFSIKRFDRSFKNEYFRNLFLYIIEGTFPDTQNQCIDLLYKQEEKMFSRNPMYHKALGEIAKRCKLASSGD